MVTEENDSGSLTDSFRWLEDSHADVSGKGRYCAFPQTDHWVGPQVMLLRGVRAQVTPSGLMQQTGRQVQGSSKVFFPQSQGCPLGDWLWTLHVKMVLRP